MCLISRLLVHHVKVAIEFMGDKPKSCCNCLAIGNMFIGVSAQDGQRGRWDVHADVDVSQHHRREERRQAGEQLGESDSRGAQAPDHRHTDIWMGHGCPPSPNNDGCRCPPLKHARHLNSLTSHCQTGKQEMILLSLTLVLWQELDEPPLK